jgi:hypothetical protein
MNKKKADVQTVQNPGSMLTQKTYEDYNKKKPLISDPNESKGKVNPERPNLADESKAILKTPRKKSPKSNGKRLTSL